MTVPANDKNASPARLFLHPRPAQHDCRLASLPDDEVTCWRINPCLVDAGYRILRWSIHQPLYPWLGRPTISTVGVEQMGEVSGAIVRSPMSEDTGDAFVTNERIFDRLPAGLRPG